MDHKFDKAGICIYCDRCPDCGMCDYEDECDRRNVIELGEMMKRIQEHFNHDKMEVRNNGNQEMGN